MRHILRARPAKNYPINKNNKRATAVQVLLTGGDLFNCGNTGEVCSNKGFTSELVLVRRCRHEWQGVGFSHCCCLSVSKLCRLVLRRSVRSVGKLK